LFFHKILGPKTSHFWGPFLNWGFVVQGLADSLDRPGAKIARNL